MILHGLLRVDDTLVKVKRSIADVSVVGAPGYFHVENEGEFTAAKFASSYGNAIIHREYTAPDAVKQNAVEKRAIQRVMKGEHAARREAPHLFPDADLAEIPHLDGDLDCSWLGVAVRVVDKFNCSGTRANSGILSRTGSAGASPSLRIMLVVQIGTLRSTADLMCMSCLSSATSSTMTATTRHLSC